MLRFSVMILAVFCAGVLQASPIGLNPGSLLVQQVNLASLTTGNLEEFTKGGALTATAQVSGTGDIAENLTVLDGNLFVSDGSGRVNLIDLATGQVSRSFNTGSVGLNGLGTYNGNLLALSFAARAVSVYTSTGGLQQVVNLSAVPSSFSWNGVASNGSTFYLADFSSGRIYEYSSTGALLGFLSTGASQLTGVAYDASNDSLWIADAATNRVIDLSTSGNVLSQFSTGSFRPGSGIAVISTNTPEPDYLPIVFVALLGGCIAGAIRRRGASSAWHTESSPQLWRQSRTTLFWQGSLDESHESL